MSNVLVFCQFVSYMINCEYATTQSLCCMKVFKAISISINTQSIFRFRAMKECQKFTLSGLVRLHLPSILTNHSWNLKKTFLLAIVLCSLFCQQRGQLVKASD